MVCSKKISALALSAAVALSCPDFAKAEGFALQDWSSRGAALAGGLVARGGDGKGIKKDLVLDNTSTH